MSLPDSPSDSATDYGTNDLEPHDNRSKVAPAVHQRHDSDSSSGSEQDGVKAIEAVARVWTPWSLIVAYTGYVLPDEITIIAIFLNMSLA